MPMVFPQTRLTLIRRLATGGSDQDWRTFHDDYWGAVCRFAMRWRGLSVEDAEDVAAATFQAILANRLLIRWQEHRAAKLRTLICGVARNIMANQARVASGRKRLLQELATQGDVPAILPTSAEPVAEQDDLFYDAWVDDLLRRVVDSLLKRLHDEGKGDYFRVLYGRVCERLSTREIAELLRLDSTTAENYFKAVKRRLADEFQAAVRLHVEHYCDDSEVGDEFTAEWNRLSDYLPKRGGLEGVVRDHFQRSLNASGRPRG